MSEDPAMTDPRGSRASRELRHVLCVEDDPHLRQLMGVALEAIGGLQLSLCASGEQALQQVAVLAPDLVLLDVQLPGMDGPAVLQALRADPATQAVPVIFMTGLDDQAALRRLRALGALEVISKPFDPLGLARQLRAIWHGTAGA
jgi:CheY-like chemotaxis protein